MTSRATEIRAKLGHPVIDADGHLVEVVPVYLDFVREVGGAGAVKQIEALRQQRPWTEMSLEQRRFAAVPATTWWAIPTANTLDRATASLPRMLANRMEELGLDFSILYPTSGVGLLGLPDEEVRRVAARAYNRYVAELYGPYSKQMTPAAIIPMHTPQEAIEELEYAKALGLKAAMIAGYVRRPVEMLQRNFPGLPDRFSGWLDTFGPESPYNYDLFWAKCVELGVAPTSRSSGFGFTTNIALTNFMQNHLGHFSAAATILCKSLFFGGVTHRFPKLRVAFLECGVGWAADLYAGIVSRWEKRNLSALEAVDPAKLDRAALTELFARYGEPRMVDYLEAIRASIDQPTVFDNNKRPPDLNDFSFTHVIGPEDIRDRFVPNFFFGCEADDPMNAVAFNTRLNPLGARLGALLSSDIGHWDVPDMREVLHEAYELVEHELLTPDDFRDFGFGNAVRLFAGANASFFTGTAIEVEVEQFVAAAK